MKLSKLQRKVLEAVDAGNVEETRHDRKVRWWGDGDGKVVTDAVRELVAAGLLVAGEWSPVLDVRTYDLREDGRRELAS